MENYRELSGLNQSLLKKILVSPSAFLKQLDQQDDSEKDHFVFGSLVDDMLLSDIEISDKYYVMKDSLSEVKRNITRYVYDMYLVNEDNEELSWSTMDEEIHDACEEYSFQTNWKSETRVKKIKEECENYFNSLVASKGKKLITEEDHYKAIIAVASLKTDPFTGKYSEEKEGIEIWKHKVITFDIAPFDEETFSIKGELDKVYIDHNAKTILPIDYKTTGSSVHMFKYDFWKFRYDFQCAVYSYGIKQDPKVIELIEKGYKVLPFNYIVVEKEMVNPPMIFRVPNVVTNIGWQGGTLVSGRKYEGFLHSLERYKFHKEKNNWDYPMEYYINGHINIEI